MLKNSSEALVNNAKALLVQKYEAQLASIVNGDYAKTLDGVSSSADGVGEKVLDAGEKAKQSGDKALEGASGWKVFWESMTSGIVVDNADMANAIDEVKKSLNKSGKPL